MALKDFILPRRTLQVGTTEVALRGLTFADLGVLVAEHRDEFVAAGNIIGAAKDNMASLASVLAQVAPRIVAHGIALAADEPEAADAVATLPAPVQLEALLIVGELTFTDPGAVPKFLAGLATLLRAGTSAMGMRQTATP
jgi:hypothetical protein